MKPLKTLFLGTPDFSLPCLELLNKHSDIELVNVISQEDKPKGRGMKLISPPVAKYAKDHNLPLLQTQNINKEDLNKVTNNFEVDLIIVLAFSHFLNQKVLNLAKLGAYNIHTSILPKYRGAAPIQYAILNGDNETGVSIQKMVLKMDAGDICKFSKVPISREDTGGSLYNKLKVEAANTLDAFLKDLVKDQLIFTPQDERKVSFAPTLSRKDGHLNFKEEPAENIFNRVRALSPWPGTHCHINQKRVKVIEAKISDSRLSPGQIDTSKNFLEVGCENGAIRLSKIQQEGKKPCDDISFLNGLQIKELTLSEVNK